MWELFTTKEGLESWWGPDGFTTSVKKLSLRPGGPIEYVMTARAAELIQGLKKMGMPASSEARGTFVEVVPRSRLAFSMVADFIPGTDPYEVLQRVEFHPTRAGVRLVVTLERMHNQQWTERSEIGWKMQLRRLAALL